MVSPRYSGIVTVPPLCTLLCISLLVSAVVCPVVRTGGAVAGEEGQITSSSWPLGQ